MMPHPAARTRFGDWPLAVKSILGFWLFYALTVIARAFLGSDPWTWIYNRSFTVGCGIVLTFGIYLAANLVEGASLRKKAAIAGLGSIIAAATLSGLAIWADRFQDKPQDEVHYVSREGYHVTELGNQTIVDRPNEPPLVITWPRASELPPYEQFRSAADIMVVWLFFFAAWSAFYIAMIAQSEAHGAERRAADAEAAAQVAQVRALRYQINPHFLFNTLNSLSSLVMTGRTDRAEAMLLALSTFFRTSLSLDPGANVTLAEEIDLQRLYLEIEKARFPDRLQVEIDVPEGLEQARLPALLLQPIVENAIKYGVSKSRKAVVIRLEARHLDDHRMVLEISNRLRNGGTEDPAASTHEGTGLGLANVCQRLDARFGSRASCRFGAMAGGGYKVSLTMPVETNG
ncbi:MAG TPA: histidine kinase [Sphingomicrobium sp.]|nr:histidine kinase [Sphingomicrobium sp.]